MQKVDALCELVSDFKIDLSNIIRGLKWNQSLFIPIHRTAGLKYR
jgi:hypothetical protein